MNTFSPEYIATHHERPPSRDEVTRRIYLKLREADVSYVDTSDTTAQVIELQLREDPATLDAMSKDLYIQSYLWSKAERVGKDSWWEIILESIERKLQELPEENRRAAAESALSVRNVHEFTVQTNHGADGKFEVIECGEDDDAALSPSELQALRATLATIDQFSGGALANTEETRHIVTTSVDMVHPHMPEEGVGGEAFYSGVLLNLRTIREVARQNNIEPEVALGAVLTHELLGHKMDRLANGGSSGTYKNHFDYSETKRPGKLTKHVHEQITPKDSGHADSRPVREYGEINAAEDLATTVDAMVSRVVGTSDALSNSERFASEPDPHREDLAMAMFDAVASAIHEQTGKGHGFIGSPVSYIEAPDGLEAVPGRQFEYAVVDPNLFMREELDKLIATQHAPAKFRFTKKQDVWL